LTTASALEQFALVDNDIAVEAGALGCVNMAGDLVQLLVRALRRVVEAERQAAQKNGVAASGGEAVNSLQNPA
jgi:hypothetical protein